MVSVKVKDNTDEVMAVRDKAVRKALEMIGLQCEGYAKLICPVDTGRLRNSITHTQEDKDTELVGSPVEYAPYVEYGTVKMSAQPYLRPAVEDHIDEYRRIAESALKGEV